jgi:hypothetical protein
MSIRWALDGVALPRNPDSWDMKWDNANVSYEAQAQGNLIRIQAPQLIAAGTLTLTWMDADQRTLNTVMQAFNPLGYGKVHQLLIDGLQPAQMAYVYYDTPQKTMSKDVVISKPGEGGTRKDITMSLRTKDAYWKSVGMVPSVVPTAAQVAALFGGPIGNGLDGIPVWNGVSWNTLIPTGGETIAISNLGTAPWSPVIRVNGPFTACTLRQTYFDVDGTGLGCSFVWTGPAVAANNWITFDTSTKRCYLVVGGQPQETYSFYVQTVSGGIPFSYWPPLLPGANTVQIITAGYGSQTSLDFSNGNANQFSYW